MDINASIITKIVNYGHKKFYDIGPGRGEWQKECLKSILVYTSFLLIVSFHQPHSILLQTRCWQNRTKRIRHLCRKTAVLSCHKCLMTTSVEKTKTFKYRWDIWPPDVSKKGNFSIPRNVYIFQSMLFHCELVNPGNTKGGSITVPLTSCLTGLE